MVYYVPFKKFPLFTQNPDFLDSGNVKLQYEYVQYVYFDMIIPLMRDADEHLRGNAISESAF